MFDNAERAQSVGPPMPTIAPGSLSSSNLSALTPPFSVQYLPARRTPGIPGAVSVELAPLNIRSCKRVLSDAGASEAQQAALTSERSLKYYVGNPGWLHLVSPIMRSGPGVTPDSFYGLMSHAMAGELSSPGASAESKVDRVAARVAGRAAALLNSWSPADGPPLRSSLTERISQLEDLPSATIVATIENLAHDKILALYPGPLGAGCVEFRHGATQAYFATRLLLADPSEMASHEMFTDSRWMLVTISLLQHGAADLALELIRAAQEIIQDIEPAPPASVLVVNRFLRSMHITEREYAEETMVGSPWSDVAYRVLRILDIGLQRRKELVTDILRDQTDRLLARAIPQATLHEKVEMLDVQRLAHDDVAAAACVMGLRSNSGPLAEAAVLQIASRSELLSMVDVRSRLGFMCAIAAEGVDPSATRYASPEAALRLRLASRTGIFTAILYGLIFGASWNH